MKLKLSKRQRQILGKLNNGVKVLSKIADTAAALREPTPLAMAAFTAKIVSAVQEVYKVSAYHYFDDWDAIPEVPNSLLLFTILHNKRLLELKAANDGEKAYTCELYGDEIGFVYGTSWCNGPFIDLDREESIAVKEETLKRVRKNLARVVWESLGASLVLDKNASGRFELKKDYVTDSASSETSERIWRRLDALRTSGHHRAILLYGEAGTGKSYIVRDIARRAGGMSLRVNFNSVDTLKDVGAMVKFLCPDAVFIDDLDRAKEQSEILAHFEVIKAVASIFLVTVNEINKLDYATLRPGRFDEIICVDALDDEVYNLLLADVENEVVCEKLRSMPVAYINEWKILKEVFGETEAFNELEELSSRRKKIRELMEDE